MILPVISGFNPDPSVCKGDDGFYLVTSSFEYFPGIPIYYSSDLEKWDLVNYAIRSKNEVLTYYNVPESCGIFAPTIRKHKDKYYIFCTFVNPNVNITDRSFVIIADHPKGEWSEAFSLDFIGIDPSPYFTDNGCYIQFSSKDDKGQSCIKQIYYNSKFTKILKSERIISYGSGGRDVEAPHVYKKDGMYYLMMSEGGTREGHMITMARSQSIWGPYELCPHNPLLTHRDRADLSVQSVGHGDLLEDDGDYYHLFCLGTRPINFKHYLGREVFYKRIYWPKYEWPYFGETLQRNKTVLSNERLQEDWQFKNALGIHWRSIRKNIRDRIKFNNGLLIEGSLSYHQCQVPSFLSIQQKSYYFSVKLEVNIGRTTAQAGLMIENGSDIFAELLYDPCRKLVIMNLNFYEVMQTVEVKVDELFFSEKEKIILIIKGDDSMYYFGYSYKGEHTHWINRQRIEIFSVETSSSPFTGVTFGPFVKGEDRLGAFNSIDIQFNHQNYKVK